MRLFSKRYHPPGTAPGTLRPPVEEAPPTPRVRLVDYSTGDVLLNKDADVGQCRDAIGRDSVTWIEVNGRPDADTLRDLGEAFSLHPLALEDVVNEGQRPKIEIYDDQLFMVLHLPSFDGTRLSMHQVSVFLHRDYLVTLCPLADDPFATIVQRIRTTGTRIRGEGPGYLFYTIIDLVIDRAFPVLERFGLELELIEEELLDRPDRDVLHRIHRVKRDMILLRRSLWPQREVVNGILHHDPQFIPDPIRVYLRDCYDHTIQIMDLVESYRDMSASLLDIYLSSASMRLNEVMRMLTVIATIFIPLTFITGVYGMNFGADPPSPWAMPELRWYYGYPLLWVIMIALVVGMLAWFHRRGWL